MSKFSTEYKVEVLDVLLEAMSGLHDGASLTKRQVQAARTRLDKLAAAERLALKDPK